jgi:PIN domain nuclease of toxin-antitoxin system
MKILLDTCAFVDLAINANSLTENAKIAYLTHEIHLSVASIWELGLKKSLGKLDFNIAGAVELLQQNDIKLLDITLPTTLLVNQLPYHHKDPFDRIIIATAQVNDMTLMTSDSIFDEYDLDIIHSR